MYVIVQCFNAQDSNSVRHDLNISAYLGPREGVNFREALPQCTILKLAFEVELP